MSAPDSVLGNVPHDLPALQRAHELQIKVAKVGFEWDNIQGVRDKLAEELAELDEAQASGDLQHIGEELGDLLFVVANYARQQGLNAEELLKQSNLKFERRFRGVEAILHEAGTPAATVPLEVMERAWQAVKKAEKEKL